MHVHNLTIVFLVTLLFGLIPLFIIRTKKSIGFSIALSGGILLGISLFHILPEALEMAGSSIGIAMMVGFFAFYIPQKFILFQPCDAEASSFRYKLGFLGFLGMLFHSMTDGVSLGATFGTVLEDNVFLAIVIHQIPASMALGFLLMGNSFSRIRHVLFVMMFALGAPVGALVTSLVIPENNTGLLAHALGFSGGNLLAIASADFFRKDETSTRAEKIVKLAFMTAGCLLTLIHID